MADRDLMNRVIETEKAALVFMMCAPSELNFAWARPDDPIAQKGPLDIETVLRRLPLSGDAKQLAREMMKAAEARNLQAAFSAIADVFRDEFWEKEPHPDASNDAFVVRTLLGR